MGLILTWLSVAVAALVVYKVFSRLVARQSYESKKRQHGCEEAQGKYPHSDPILGIDLLVQDEKQRADSEFLHAIQEQFADFGKTHEVIFLGGRMIRTMEPKNMQAILGLKASDYGLQPLREGMAEPFFGKGINTMDGDFWQYSRSLIKPTFSRVDICNFTSLELHFQRMLQLLPTDGSTVDLQPLFSRLFLDTSTEFLFGKSAGTLAEKPDPTGESFVECFDYVMQGFGTRVRMGPFKFLHRDPVWFRSVQTVHAFVDNHIDDALDAERKRQQGILEKSEIDRHYVLLREMVKGCQDKLDLRSQIIAVFMPSRDTSGHFVSNVFWELARRPDVFSKLRKQVLDLGDQRLTFETLKSMKYLQWIINETHRMYAISENNPRCVLADTVLPTGGGKDGTSPIFLSKGDYVSLNLYCLHHNPDYWGPDHDKFRPERWDGLKPFWNFIPFGGGPRTCPAQQLVNTEAAYLICRMVQEFSVIEARDERPWTEAWGIGPYSKYGCNVAVVKS